MIYILSCNLLFAIDIIKINYPDIPFYAKSNNIKKCTIISDDNNNFKQGIKDIKKVKNHFDENYFKENKIILSFDNIEDYNMSEFQNLGLIVECNNQKINSPINGVVIQKGFDPYILKKYIVLKVEKTNYEIIIANLSKIDVNKDSNINKNEIIGESTNKQIFIMLKSGNNFYDPVRVISNNSITYFLNYKKSEDPIDIMDHHYISFFVDKINYQPNNEQLDHYINDLNHLDIKNPINSDFKNKSLDFGDYIDKKNNATHLGIDYISENGTSVYAATSGKIIKAAYSVSSFGSFSHGLCVIIKSNDFYFLYAHLGSLYVKEGGEIKMGDKIGRTGNTGYSYKPSLHLSIMKDGFYINPDLIFKE